MRAKYLALAALLGAAGLAWLAAAEKKKPAPALPAELAGLPRDEFLLVSLRPADLWASEAGKAFRKRMGKDLELFTGEIERALGLSLEQVERVSFVMGL